MNDRLSPAISAAYQAVAMDLFDYARFVAALSIVLGLIAACAYAVRHFGLAPRLTTGTDRRVRIVEIATVDARRQLLLLRRDGTEHLVLLGPSGDLVVESGIEAIPVANEDYGVRPSEAVITWPGFASVLRRLKERRA
jgi:flagellar protein FliO/FliZ